MADKLDILERDLRALMDASGQAGQQTTIDRRLEDRRLNIERRWAGQMRWIYITAVDVPELPDIDYSLFLG